MIELNERDIHELLGVYKLCDEMGIDIDRISIGEQNYLNPKAYKTDKCKTYYITPKYNKFFTDIKVTLYNY